MAVRLFVKDNTNGAAHEYGDSPHDSLLLTKDGSLHYENLQNCTGTQFPEEGYSFCDENGNVDFECPETGDKIYDIGGYKMNFERKGEKKAMKLTKKASDVKRIKTDNGDVYEIDLTPQDMRLIHDEQTRVYVTEDVREQIERMVYNETITQEQMDSFLENEEAVQAVVTETIRADITDFYWLGIKDVFTEQPNPKSVLSTKTQKNYLGFISGVFRYAISCNMIEKNPCKGVHVIITEPKERDVYTLEEAQTFVDHLDTAPLKYKSFFTLAIYGGFRRGEILGLEWSDIDFVEHTISIKRTSLYSKEKGMFTSTPKTKSSVRTLKLPDQIFDLLRELKAEQAKQRFAVGDRWNENDRLFIQWDGSPMGPDTVRHWLRKFCDEEGLRYVSIHSFRHLNASLLISNGADVKTVSSALGHAQTTTTMNIYAHSFAEVQARASEALANALRFDPSNADKKDKNA